MTLKGVQALMKGFAAVIMLETGTAIVSWLISLPVLPEMTRQRQQAHRIFRPGKTSHKP